MPERLHDFETDAIKVTWSKRRCTHAAECVFGLPQVFEPGVRPWIKPENASADAVAGIVQRCPTGALHYERKDGGANEAVPDANAMRIMRHGPYYLRGDVLLENAAGEVELRDTRVALCRCGRSQNPPYCDNAHRESGFRDEGELFAGGVKAEDPPAHERAVHVQPLANGPLLVSGPLTIRSGDGRVKLDVDLCKLCRCGQSRNKPFCDGSHLDAGFAAP